MQPQQPQFDPFTGEPVAPQGDLRTGAPNDPWASLAPVAPAPPTQVPEPNRNLTTGVLAPAPEPTGRATAVAPAAQVQLDSQTSVVVTFKGDGGAPWIVVHCSDIEDAYEHVAGAKSKILANTMEAAWKANAHFARFVPANPNRGQQFQQPQQEPQQQQRQQAPAAAQQAPGGEQRFCAHGEMNFRSGLSQKTGKAYKGFFCSSGNRNEECDAQFLR